MTLNLTSTDRAFAVQALVDEPLPEAADAHEDDARRAEQEWRRLAARLRPKRYDPTRIGLLLWCWLVASGVAW